MSIRHKWRVFERRKETTVWECPKCKATISLKKKENPKDPNFESPMTFSCRDFERWMGLMK